MGLYILQVGGMFTAAQIVTQGTITWPKMLNSIIIKGAFQMLFGGFFPPKEYPPPALRNFFCLQYLVEMGDTLFPLIHYEKSATLTQEKNHLQMLKMARFWPNYLFWAERSKMRHFGQKSRNRGFWVKMPLLGRKFQNWDV